MVFGLAESIFDGQVSELLFPDSTGEAPASAPACPGHPPICVGAVDCRAVLTCWRAQADWCLVLAGWDGEQIPARALVPPRRTGQR